MGDYASECQNVWEADAVRKAKIRAIAEQKFADYWKHDLSVTDYKIALDNDDDHASRLHKALVDRDHAEIGRIFFAIVEAYVWQWCEDRAANEVDDD